MKDILESLQSLQNTPIPNLLVIAGFLFLLMAFVGRIGAIIELPRPRQKWAGITGTVLLISGIGLSIQPKPLTPIPAPVTPTASVTASTSLASTPTPMFTNTITPVGQAATTTATSTPTGEFVPDTAEQAAIATITALESADWKLIRVGPEEGDLNGEGESRIIRTNVNLRDLITSARFYNPSDTVEGTWSHGFYIRDNPGTSAYFIIVTSGYDWYLRMQRNTDEYSEVGRGRIDSEILNIATGEFNDIKLVVKGQTAWLLINGNLIDIIDLPEDLGSGKVSISTGFYTGDKDDVPTRFEDFRVWSLDQE